VSPMVESRVADVGPVGGGEPPAARPGGGGGTELCKYGLGYIFNFHGCNVGCEPRGGR
jgi:hypothetical protein